MKHIISFLLVFWSITLWASESNMSLQTLQLIDSHEQAKKNSATTYSLGENGKSVEETVSVFVTVDNTFNPQSLPKIGASIGLQTAQLLTVQLPVDKIAELSALPGVLFINAGNKAKPILNKAVPAIHADEVWIGGANLPRSYTGAGVVVGIVDLGMDVTHPMFYDREGKLKIKRIWNQNTKVEYTTENALLGLQSTNTQKSHGTHVAGITAGTGGWLGHYVGVAPNADLVFVETTAQTPDIIEGIKYVFDYADEVGKPAVVNLSLGMHSGPHNGTSDFDKTLDALVGAGRIVVGAAGNEGSTELHTQYSFSKNETRRIAVEASDKGEGNFCALFSPAVNFEWAVEIWDKRNKVQKEATSFFASAKNDRLFNKTFTVDGAIIKLSADSYGKDDTRYIPAYLEVMFENSAPDRWSVVIVFRATTGTVHVWNAENEPLTALKSDGTWLSPDVDYTAGEVGGTAKRIITVGSYNIRDMGTNKDGEVSYFSSHGPTVDGRSKPDILAPGSFIRSSINSFDEKEAHEVEVLQTTEPDNTHQYAMMSGTSMAAPMVTGAVALMLQANATLTPDTIKGLLKKYATIDDAISNLSINTRGFGKINIYKTIENINDRADLPIITAVPQRAEAQGGFKIIPNPNNGTFSLSFDHGDRVQLLVYNLVGSLKYTTMIAPFQEVQLTGFPSGMYIIKLVSNNRQLSQKMLIIRNGE